MPPDSFSASRTASPSLIFWVGTTCLRAAARAARFFWACFWAGFFSGLALDPSWTVVQAPEKFATDVRAARARIQGTRRFIGVSRVIGSFAGGGRAARAD